MSKTLIITAVLSIVGTGSLITVNQITKSKEPIVGVQHASQGQAHIKQGEAHDAYNSDPASSGPHYADSSAPTDWGIYTQEVPDEVFIHNEEHGGVIVTYQPELLPSDQLKKLQDLFNAPYSNKAFSPIKFIITPRSKDKHAIELASWTYTLNLDAYDETTIIKFFNQHAGRAPEPTAGPFNTPINQAAGK